MKYSELTRKKRVTVNGYSTGIIRKVDDNGDLYPPKSIMLVAGLTEGRKYVTVRLANGGIALIPLDEENGE